MISLQHLATVGCCPRYSLCCFFVQGSESVICELRVILKKGKRTSIDLSRATSSLIRRADASASLMIVISLAAVMCTGTGALSCRRCRVCRGSIAPLQGCGASR